MTGERTDDGADPRDDEVPLPAVSSAESTFREVNGVELHVVAAGDPADPLVVLLHGFPEFWYGWRAYVEPLVGAGYRVLVPDQRGYNRSEKPKSVRAYRLSALSGDVVELVRSEGQQTAHVVGHDWGGGVAWDLARRHPDLVDRLGIVNAPHSTVLRRAVWSNPAQLRRSWYILFFQLPWIPEWLFRRNDFEAWVRTTRDEALPGAFTASDVERYRRAWSRPGAVSAMLDWYRAAFRYGDEPSRDRVSAPTLVVWGENDSALVPELAVESVDFCDDGRLERFSDATHWITHEYPDRVAELLIDHLRDRSSDS